MPKKQPSYKGYSFFKVPYKKGKVLRVKSKCNLKKNKICNAAYVAYGVVPKDPERYKRGAKVSADKYLRPLTYTTVD